jgi:hypothetical protein
MAQAAYREALYLIIGNDSEGSMGIHAYYLHDTHAEEVRLEFVGEHTTNE